MAEIFCVLRPRLRNGAVRPCNEPPILQPGVYLIAKAALISSVSQIKTRLILVGPFAIRVARRKQPATETSTTIVRRNAFSVGDERLNSMMGYRRVSDPLGSLETTERTSEIVPATAHLRLS